MPSDTYKYCPPGQLPYPGSCIICASDLRGCIDFGVSLDNHGALIICKSCMGEIVNVEELGLMRRKDAEEAMAQNEILNNREGLLDIELGVMRHGLVAVIDHFSDVLHESRTGSVDNEQDPDQIDIDFYGADET